MCNLYNITRNKEAIARLFNAQLPFDLPEIKPHIYPKGTGYVVIDLDSTNGTKVNGIRVREQELVDGDELTFDNTRMRFEAS